MHAFTHSLAHRAPPASRTRGRWQPYAAIPSSSSSSSSSSSASSSSARISPASYLYTPATSVNTPPAHKTPASDSAPSATISKDASRDGNRTKFALSLVDQSVKTLCDIWRPQDIPQVYSSPKPQLPVDSTSPLWQSQLLTKSSSTSSILASSTHPASQPPAPTAPVLIQAGTSETPCPLVPIGGFVRDVLRRSKTSGGVLQTALCYLEAIRPKLRDLIQQEKQGTGLRGEPEPTSSITLASEAELQEEAELAKSELDTVVMGDHSTDEILDTVRIPDDESELQFPRDESTFTSLPSLPPSQPAPRPSNNDLPPAPLLPSPLLCPRRTFLAALILASKFTQDKCYSNRAWAKLSGLPPREIGRCERALGNALEWRLWVGKAAAPAVPTASSAVPSNKPVARSQSEPSLSFAGSPPQASRGDQSMEPMDAIPARKGFLRRSSTLPAGKFPDCYLQSSAMDTSSDSGFLQPPPARSETSTSPFSDVPGLSYSPSSTESSSSGERTIQMSTFLEDNMAPPMISEGSQTWSWMEGEPPAGIPGLEGISSSPVAIINGKLLTGNGLGAFQGKTATIGRFNPSFTGSIDSLASPAYHQHKVSPVDNVRVFDPTAGFGFGYGEGHHLSSIQ